MNRLLRHIVSIVLLAIYLPMIVLSSLHVHHDTIDAHDDCQQCVGHVEEAHHHDHDCLYCNFLSLDCMVQDEGQTVDLLPVTKCIATPTPTAVLQFHHGVARLRAPPAA